jgi:hypothetical protein
MGILRRRALKACGVIWACWACASLACSQGDRTPPYIPDPPTDSSTTPATDAAKESGPSCTSGEDGGCNSLLNCGNKIYIQQNSTASPTAAGGTVPDGTYVLTGYMLFTGPGGASGPLSTYFTETMQLTTEASDASIGDGGATQQMVWADIIASNGSSNTTSAGTAYFQTGAASMTIAKSCPSSPNPFSAGYTVSGTQLLLYAADTTGTAQLTYTKQ